MPEEDRPKPEPIRHVGMEEEAPPRPEPPPTPEAVKLLLSRLTFPATKAEIVSRVGADQIAIGEKRVSMDELMADVPGDAYATMETVARLVTLQVRKRFPEREEG